MGFVPPLLQLYHEVKNVHMSNSLFVLQEDIYRSVRNVMSEAMKKSQFELLEALTAILAKIVDVAKSKMVELNKLKTIIESHNQTFVNSC